MRRCLNVLLERIMSTKCFQDAVGEKHMSLLYVVIHPLQGRNGLIIVKARKESERFHNLAWWQHELRVGVTIVIHETNTGTLKPKYRATFLRI